jgi:hypothetical protein
MRPFHAIPLTGLLLAFACTPPQAPTPDAGGLFLADAGPQDAGPLPPGDETPPVVKLNQPDTPCLSGVVTFAFATLDEESPVGFVRATFAGNVLDLTSDESGAHEATFDVSGLFTGTHLLTIKAIDTANNEADFEQTFGVLSDGTYVEGPDFVCGTDPNAPTEDTQAPQIELLHPLPDQPAHSNANLEVRAFVTDDVGPVMVTAQVGQATTQLDGAFAQYVGHLDLSGETEGAQTLILTATDDAQHTTTLEKELTLDLTAPAVNIIEPSAGASRAALHDVIVEVDDVGGVALVSLYDLGSGRLLGRATDPSPGTENRYGIIYQFDCTEVPGTKSLEVQARDFASNIGTAQVTIDVGNAGCAE